MAKNVNNQVMEKKVPKKVNKFKQLAEESLILSELHKGREKLETASITGVPLTIMAFDIVEQDDNTRYATMVFAEYPEFYYNGGTVLTKMVDAWLDEFGDVDAAMAAYNDSEPLVIQLEESKTRDGKRSVTKVSIVEE